LAALAKENAGKLHIIELDVADEASIHHATKRIAELTPSLDLLINNAGIYPGRPGAVSGSDRLGQLTMESGVATLRTNAIGPMILTQELLPLLRKGRQPRIVSLTSGLGSIAQSSGAPYHYSASKAALNMYMHGVAAELRRDHIISVVINPGWVATDMGGRGASLPTSESVNSILRVVEKLTMEQSGAFFNYRGEIEPW
jgi:NAD(P)-dependent dehydrogenase (short-subunit alcohol dehydrogenase family)